MDGPARLAVSHAAQGLPEDDTKGRRPAMASSQGGGPALWLLQQI